MALTGLTWSFSWYRTGFYACFGVESSENGGAHGEGGNSHGEGRGSRGEGRYSHGDGRNNHEGNHGEGRGFHRRSPYRHWEDVLNEVALKNPGYQQITLKPEVAEVVPEGRLSMRAADKYSYDRRSGEITDVQLYSAGKKDTKARSGVYMVHTGSWGGIITRILNFLAAFIGATLPLTGYWLWFRRKRAAIAHHH